METFYKQRDPKTGGYKKVFYDRNEKSAFEFKEKREQKKAEKAYKIFELRIKGQISYELIDNILEVNGIQKWSKEAEKFMYELDGEMAMEVLKSGKEVKDEDLANKVTSILVDKFFEAKEEKPEAISETPTIETEESERLQEALRKIEELKSENRELKITLSNIGTYSEKITTFLLENFNNFGIDETELLSLIGQTLKEKNKI